MPDLLSRHGIHAPNCRFADFRRVPDGPIAGADAAWGRVQAAQARWIKLLAPDHSRADAVAAQAHGCRVLVRAPGEGFPYVADVQALIAEFAGVCDIIEVGNEPYLTDQFPTWDALYWNHAWYLDAVWAQCADAAHASGIQLCTPGWQAGREPPIAGAGWSPALAARLQSVYRQYDAIGVHCYDVFTLAAPAVLDHVARWHALFPQPIYITEYGIAARYLIPGRTTPADQPAGDREKARRYAAFLRALGSLPYVQAAFLFLLGGTRDWASFRNGAYDPHGDSSYWLDDRAYATLGQALLPNS